MFQFFLQIFEILLITKKIQKYKENQNISVKLKVFTITYSLEIQHEYKNFLFINFLKASFYSNKLFTLIQFLSKIIILLIKNSLNLSS